MKDPRSRRDRPLTTTVRTDLDGVSPSQTHRILAYDLFHLDTLALTRLYAFFIVSSSLTNATPR